jgi:hypothetical protein
MSALLRAVRSFDQNWRHIRPSEESDMPSVRPIALLRDLGAPESEAKSNPFGGQQRAGALLKKLIPWQVRATALITLLGPPAASFILILFRVLADCSFQLRRLPRCLLSDRDPSWVWFCEWLSASGIYGLVGAFVMAALSVSRRDRAPNNPWSMIS